MASDDRAMMPLRAKLPLAAAGAALAGVAAWAALRPRVMTWGATVEEVRQPLPGDDLIAMPLYVTTRGITVHAPAAAVWPWLVQLGQNRGGFYSYDFLENLMGLDIHNAEAVRPEWQDLKPGEDYLTLDPEANMKMTIAVMEPERAFVVRSGAPGEPPQPPGDFFKGEIACTWGFYLEPLGERRHAAGHPLARGMDGHARHARRAADPPRTGALHHGGAHAARHPRPGGARHLTYHA